MCYSLFTLMIKKVRYLVAIITASFLLAGYAPIKKHASPEIVMQYDPHLENTAIGLLRTYPKIKAELENLFGWKIEFIPIVTVTQQNDLFQRMSNKDLITAFAVPGKNFIVIDSSKANRTPFELEATFKHELVHLMLHQNIPAIPKWLDEGIAQWASSGIADIINPYNENVLKQAALSNNLIPLRDLSLYFPDHPRGLVLAYEQSKSFIEFIESKYGKEKIVSILNNLKNNKSIRQAINEELSIELESLEQKWHKSLLRKYSWLSYIADNIIWVLFFAAALVTLVGYIRLRWRMKNYKDEDEIEDEQTLV